jgi:hypothetical protein
MKRFGILNIVLIALIALAVWRTVGVWRRGAPERAASEEAAAAGRAIELPPQVRTPPLPQLVATIADKDLFDQSRKPPEQAAPTVVATPAPPPPTLKLAGVIVVGSQREALLVDTAQGNKQLRMREGEELSGYKIGKIETEQIALVGPGGEQTIVQMVIDKNAAPKRGFGPGGVPAPGGAGGVATATGGALRPPKGPPPGAPQATNPAQMGRGAIAPADPGADARQRAESARERLKRLRAEAARQ